MTWNLLYPPRWQTVWQGCRRNQCPPGHYVRWLLQGASPRSNGDGSQGRPGEGSAELRGLARADVQDQLDQGLVLDGPLGLEEAMGMAPGGGVVPLDLIS